MTNPILILPISGSSIPEAVSIYEAKTQPGGDYHAAARLIANYLFNFAPGGATDRLFELFADHLDDADPDHLRRAVLTALQGLVDNHD